MFLKENFSKEDIKYLTSIKSYWFEVNKQLKTEETTTSSTSTLVDNNPQIEQKKEGKQKLTQHENEQQSLS